MPQVAAAILLLLVAVLAGCDRPTGVDSTARPDDEHRKRHLKSFDEVWMRVRDNHWDKNLNGVDWDAAGKELRPQVESARTNGEARAAMRQLLSRLKQSHFGIIPREDYERFEKLRRYDPATPPSGFPGSSGIRIRIVEGMPLVSQVRPGSAGDKSGVRAGWILLRANSEDAMKQLQAPIPEQVAINEPAFRIMIVQGLLSGEVGTTIEAVFRDGEGQEVQTQITLEPPPGTPIVLRDMPAYPVFVQVKEIEQGIGYFSCSSFSDPTIASGYFRFAVQRFVTAKGLIIDLRSNPGGLLWVAAVLAGWLVDRDGLDLGTAITRDSTSKLVIKRQPDAFTGPVAILVDELTMSAGEVLASAMQDIGRARIFGTRTGGSVLLSQIEKLPNGDGFQYAAGDFLSRQGKALEGIGVDPDEHVVLTRDELLAGHDPAVVAAVKWIRTRRN